MPEQHNHHDSQNRAHQHINHLTHPKYRPDIDGLRAVAVLSVVAFHAFPEFIHGGFIGVDIFFVISGFLISTIIFSSLERDAFSFTNFYSRRIRRIFPALLIVLGFCFAFGWFVLLPDGYKQLGKHIAGGAGFISNFLLLRESGYFDNAAETKPLLHLWSLGVEEQFYILWPLLLWAAWKKHLNFLAITVSIVAVSFTLNIAKYQSDPVTDFYSPLTRFWELLAGSVLAYIQQYKLELQSRLTVWMQRFSYVRTPGFNGAMLLDVQSMLGGLLIATSVFMITRENHFPGFLALLPVLGAVLVIAAGSHAWLNHAVLSNRVLVWFGLISYPLYLWHWPLLSFTRIVERDTPSPGMRIAAVLLSIVLAWLTYKLIEKPLRFGKSGKLKTITLLLLMTIVGYLGYITHKQDGLQFRKILTSQNELVIHLSKITDVYTFFDIASTWRTGLCFAAPKSVDISKKMHDCVDQERPLVFIWGDSYAATLYAGLLKLQKATPNTFGVAQFTSSNAPPFFDNQKRTTDWIKENRSLFEVNEENLKVVSLTQPKVILLAWKFDGENAIKDKAESLAEIDSTIKKIKLVSSRSKVIVVGPLPHWKGTLKDTVIQYSLNHRGDLIPIYTRYGLIKEPEIWDEFFKDGFKKLGIPYISTQDTLCNKDGCLTRTGEKPMDLTAIDYGHLSKSGSEYLINKIQVEIFK